MNYKILILLMTFLSCQSFSQNISSKYSYIEILDYNETDIMSGSTCYAKIIGGDLFKITYYLNKYYGNSNFSELIVVYNPISDEYIYNYKGRNCINGVFYETPINIKPLFNNDLLDDIMYSFKIWLDILEEKGIDFLIKHEFSPLFLTNLDAKKVNTRCW